MDRPLRIAVLGGVPAPLGGGGLEEQVNRTAEALERRGHEVFHAARERVPRPFDVLHVFSSEPDVCHAVGHWRRSPAPLVVSPVIVATRVQEALLRVGARLPSQSFSMRARADLLARADVVVAQTARERRLVRQLGAGRVVEVPNGVASIPAGSRPDLAGLDLPDRYALLLGTVSARKRQAETVRGLAGAALPLVVVGGFDGSTTERNAFEDAVAAAGARWLGEVDQATAREILARATVLIHLSSAEGQPLALLEALDEETPVIASPLPGAQELAARHPGWVTIAPDVAAARRALARDDASAGARPRIPTWDDVAAALEPVYELARASARS